MSARRSLSIELPQDLADVVEAKLATGDYASESDVISDGLRALMARDVENAEVETWLRESVLPLARNVNAGVAQLSNADETWEKLQRHMDRRNLSKAAS